ncbi:MAG: thioredoxin family protein [Acidobacteriota bacterium]
MRRFIFIPVFIAFFVMSVVAQEKTAKTDWSDTTRDVLIDGEIDRSAQVLSAGQPTRLALLSPKFEKAILLDVNSKSVNTVAKDIWKFSPDKSSATTEGTIELKPIGKYVRVDGANSSFVYTFNAEGKMIVIRAHPGLTGELTEDKVWATVPVWRAGMDTHKPDAKAVAAIKASDKETNITIIFGTWCGDSKHYVPQLLKALHEANNPKLKIKLVGIDNQFNQPTDVVQPRKLINVPTVIVERGGREIGRIIETPATASVEEDLATILQEKPLTHNGRWDRVVKLGQGVYEYRDAFGKTVGKEDWELFSTAEGGYMIHSRVTTGDLTTEIFHRINAKKNPTFVEVTKTQGDNLTRTRYNIDDHSLSATLRGNVSGGVKQTLEIPAQLAMASPCVAAEGWMSAQVREGQVTSYLVPREFANTAGTLFTINNQSLNEENVKTPAGEFRAQHIIRMTGKETSEWWVHSQLGIPVRGKLANGTEFVLTSLEVAPKN